MNTHTLKLKIISFHLKIEITSVLLSHCIPQDTQYICKLAMYPVITPRDQHPGYSTIAMTSLRFLVEVLIYFHILLCNKSHQIKFI